MWIWWRCHWDLEPTGRVNSAGVREAEDQDLVRPGGRVIEDGTGQSWCWVKSPVSSIVGPRSLARTRGVVGSLWPDGARDNTWRYRGMARQSLAGAETR